MPETLQAAIDFRHKQMNVLLDDRSSEARIRVHAARFGGAALEADIAIVRPPGHETLNVVIPWSRDRFQFTSKQNTSPLPAPSVSGLTSTSSKREVVRGPGLRPRSLEIRLLLELGRRLGVQGGQTVGLNLGGGWTDGTGMTENGICVDGRLTKIGDDLEFTYDSDYMRQWSVRSRASDASIWSLCRSSSGWQRPTCG
jgi:hypothetical protein